MNPVPWLNTGSPSVLPGIRWATSGMATTLNITWHHVQPSTRSWSILCWCKGNFDCYLEDRLLLLENLCRYKPFLNLLPLIFVRDTTLSFTVIHEQLPCRPVDYTCNRFWSKLVAADNAQYLHCVCVRTVSLHKTLALAEEKNIFSIVIACLI